MADKEYLFAVRGYALADVSVAAGSFEEAEARVWVSIGCSEGQQGTFRLVADTGMGFIECGFAADTVSIRRARALGQDGMWVDHAHLSTCDPRMFDPGDMSNADIATMILDMKEASDGC